MAESGMVQKEHLTRSKDWPEQLAAFLDARIDTPFFWGKNDCCLFAADAVIAITGTDIAADVRGVYASAKSAKATTKVFGGLAQLAADRLGPEIRPMFAKRGDILLVKGADGREFLAVCVGDAYAGPGPIGTVYGPMTDVLNAWSV